MLCRNCGKDQTTHLWGGLMHGGSELRCPVGTTLWKAPGAMETLVPRDSANREYIPEHGSAKGSISESGIANHQNDQHLDELSTSTNPHRVDVSGLRTSGYITRAAASREVEHSRQGAAYPTIECSNPKFAAALNRMRDTHDRKSADYATNGNRYSNFEEAASASGCSVDEVFAVLIGIKMARLKELIQSGKTPQNESVLDSKLDLANYSTLWLSYGLEG